MITQHTHKDTAVTINSCPPLEVTFFFHISSVQCDHRWELKHNSSFELNNMNRNCKHSCGKYTQYITTSFSVL